MRAALLLVDWQNDFLGRGGLVPGGERVVEGAAALLGGCRARDVPVFHARLSVDGDVDTRMPHWKEADRWMCVRGSEGWESPGALKVAAGEAIIEKAFFRVFAGGDLSAALRRERVDTVILSGLYTHACVRLAAIDAYELGYRVLVASDAVASDAPLAAAEARLYLAKRGVVFGRGHEILKWLDEGTVRRLEERVEEDVDDVVARGVVAQECWRREALDVRKEIVRAFAVRVVEEGESLARLIVESVGKPITFARGEIARCEALADAVCRVTSGVASGEAFADGSRARREPVGVVAMLTPFNHPLAIAMGKLVPALVYGNAVVWKPAPEGEALAECFVELAELAGLPEGLLTVVGGGAETGMSLMEHAGIDAVTMTGGSEAGYAAQYICGARRIPLQAELGGNNASIVWGDSDFVRAAGAISFGAFGYAGQRCTANRRAIVEAGVLEPFLQALEEATADLVCGDPFQEATHVGPLVSEAARLRVSGIVERARRDGLRIVQAVGDVSVPGPWYPPTIIVCDDETHEVVCEETFGPLLVVQPAATWAEALQLCNGVEEGLVAALFSESEARCESFLTGVRAGVLKIGESTADVGVEAPFGGWKRSGVGPPEHGAGNPEFYTRWQAIYRGGA